MNTHQMGSCGLFLISATYQQEREITSKEKADHGPPKPRANPTAIWSAFGTVHEKLWQTPWATLLLFCVDAAQKLVPPPEFPRIIFTPRGAAWLPMWMPLVKTFDSKGMKHHLQHWKRSRGGTRKESWRVHALRSVYASLKL